jgi:hypothetical protein
MCHLRRQADQRSWRDLLDVLDAVAKAKAGFRSLKDTWADTTTPAWPPHADAARWFGWRELGKASTTDFTQSIIRRIAS